MYSIRHRPLTWHFWIATACLDAIAVARDHEASLANALVLGQLFVASGWLILGRPHRLARAGVLATTIGLLSLPDFIFPRLRGGFYRDLVWPHVLAMLIVMAAVAAFMTWLWWSMAKLTSFEPRQARTGKRQFPLAEVFGWMIVVAVGSLAIRWADFSQIDDSVKDLATGLALTSLAGAMMALVVGDYGRGGKFRVLSASGLVLLYANALLYGLPREALSVAVGALAFVGIWAAVISMDNPRRRKIVIGEIEPPVRLEDRHRH